LSDHDDDSEGMTLDDFMRMIAGQRPQTDEEEREQQQAREGIERAHLAIHTAIQTEYRALHERCMMTDALRDQPDISVETGGRGYAQHYLAARMAGVLAKHIGNGPKQEFEAQRLEHLAQLQRWIPVIAQAVVKGGQIDDVLTWLSHHDK
jgi:hypothetical protein